MTDKEQYEIPQNESFFIDQAKGEVVDSKNLTPFQIIKLTAQQLGVEVQEPRKGCKKCYGRGYVGIMANTREPVPCQCIYSFKQKRQAEKENKRTFVTRQQKRKMQRLFKKQTKNMKVMPETSAVNDSEEK